MLAILNSLNAQNFSIFEPILMILVPKFMVYRVLSDKIYLSLGLLSPLSAIPQDTTVKAISPINSIVTEALIQRQYINLESS